MNFDNGDADGWAPPAKIHGPGGQSYNPQRVPTLQVWEGPAGPVRIWSREEIERRMKELVK